MREYSNFAKVYYLFFYYAAPDNFTYQIEFVLQYYIVLGK